MQVTIQRYNNGQALDEAFEVGLETPTLLEALTYIKQHHDASLTFSSGCRSSVCGSCAMRVNDTEVLACSYKVQEGDRVTALQYAPVVRDLVVDQRVIEVKNRRAKNFVQQATTPTQTQEQVALFELQSDCILCGACYSACPVMAVNENFLGPYALTRSYRYVKDSRNSDEKGIVDAIVTDGIWDCTLCNECVPVCPQGIAPKQDIAMLQGVAGTMGHMNPKFGGGMDFGGGFGTPDFGVNSF